MFKILISSPDAEIEYFHTIDDLALQLQYLLSTAGQPQTVDFAYFEFLQQRIPGLQGPVSTLNLKALINQLNFIKRQSDPASLLLRLFGALTVITDDVQEAIEQMDEIILGYTEELAAESHFTNLLFTDNVTCRLKRETLQIIQQHTLMHLSIRELQQKLFSGLLAIHKFGPGSLLVQY